MKRPILTLIAFISLLSGCGEIQKVKTENIFYEQLDSLKNEYIGKEITISKRKFNEDADPLTNLYLYTSADRDNLADEVRFWDGATYRLTYDQISENEYRDNFLDKNLMVQVEFVSDSHTPQIGWISIENIREFQAIEPYLKQVR